jgi:hypothetical protein
VQTTAPSLGAANVRIQGLRGRYSQVLSDGLPLYGAQGDSFTLLQVPPLDLGQVEVIKGAASALYGTAALGGFINLVSRRPAVRERLAPTADTSTRRTCCCSRANRRCSYLGRRASRSATAAPPADDIPHDRQPGHARRSLFGSAMPLRKAICCERLWTTDAFTRTLHAHCARACEAAHIRRSTHG